jgi:hypothetical protein
MEHRLVRAHQRRPVCHSHLSGLRGRVALGVLVHHVGFGTSTSSTLARTGTTHLVASLAFTVPLPIRHAHLQCCEARLHFTDQPLLVKARLMLDEQVLIDL